jgi:hypothetical protein
MDTLHALEAVAAHEGMEGVFRSLGRNATFVRLDPEIAGWVLARIDAVGQAGIVAASETFAGRPRSCGRSDGSG